MDFDLREVGEDSKRMKVWVHNLDGSGGEGGLKDEVFYGTNMVWMLY